MRYGVAALVAAFVLFAGVALAGAGHGWVSGGFGCFALAPLSFFAWANALGRAPSIRGAVAVLAAGFAVCVAVAFKTASEGVEYFFRYWRIAGVAGVLIGGFAYLNWIAVSVLAIVRARRVASSGA